MPIYFVTGSANKFKEVKAIIPEVEQLEINLPEIQEIDSQKIVAQKLYHASGIHNNQKIIVDDTSLYFDCLKGLPGPLIRWFEETLGHDGLAELVEKYGNSKARAQTILGYTKNAEEILLFSGITEGNIVRPRGEKKFSWDIIFKPKGYEKTFAEMTSEEKNAISPRGIAARKLKRYLESSA